MVHTHEVTSSSLVPATKFIEGVGNVPVDQDSDWGIKRAEIKVIDGLLMENAPGDCAGSINFKVYVDSN